MQPKRVSLLAALLVGLCCLLVSGCQTRLSEANLAKITSGMTEEEVFAILGKGKLVKPDADFPNLPGMARSQAKATVASGTCYQWNSGRTILIVRFVDGKVTGQFSGTFNSR